QAQVGYLGDLNKSSGLLTYRGILQAFFAARQDSLFGILPDADYQWKAKFVTVGVVQLAKGLVLLRREAIEPRRTLIPQGLHTQQTRDPNLHYVEHMVAPRFIAGRSNWRGLLRFEYPAQIRVGSYEFELAFRRCVKYGFLERTAQLVETLEGTLFPGRLGDPVPALEETPDLVHELDLAQAVQLAERHLFLQPGRRSDFLYHPALPGQNVEEDVQQDGGQAAHRDAVAYDNLPFWRKVLVEIRKGYRTHG